MLIEADARRFITEAINLEKELTNVEKVEKANYRFTFLKMLKAFVQLT